LRAAGADQLTALIAGRPPRDELGRAELSQLVDLVQSPGFCFTRLVQRSSCLGRSAGAAQLTLSVLPTEQRRQLVEDWVVLGGGTAFDPAIEADAFLDFVASQLGDPSHELTVCRMEQATYRASEAARGFRPPGSSFGRWIEYAGGFTDMLAQRAEAPRGLPPTKARRVRQAQPATQSGALPSGLPRRMNFNDRRALDMLPARIAALETQIAELNAVLADPDLYARDPARFSATAEALAVARDELAGAEEQWLRLEMLREEIEAAEPGA
jgi:hypothetical protein